MIATDPHRGCYLAEWYRPELTKNALDDATAQLVDGVAAVSADGSTVRLLAVLAAPRDDVLYGVFTADSQQIVEQACRSAGFAVDRLTDDVDARFLSDTNPQGGG